MCCAILMKKNNLNGIKNNQFGRSMIEMLGVLAVVGVLSVSGIAGFSETMTRYRTNRTVEQVMELAANLALIGEQSGTYDGLNNEVAIKMKAIPSGISIAETTLTNLFNGTVTVEPSVLTGDSATEAFAITYTGLSSDVCIRLAAQDWQSGNTGSLLGVGFGASEDSAANLKGGIVLDCTGSAATGAVIGCPKDITFDHPNMISVSEAVEGCSCSTDTCVMVIKFF